MSNTLTAILPTAFAAAVEIQKSNAGFVLGSTVFGGAEQIGKGTTVKVPVVPDSASLTSFTPAQTPTAIDQTPTANSITMSNAYKWGWHVTGEEMRALEIGAPGDILMEMMRQNIQIGIGKLLDAMDAALAAYYDEAAYAYGTAGTTPCASDLTALANVKALADREGYAGSDLQAVLDSAAAANVMTQAGDASKLGSDDIIRNGNIGRLFGLAVRSSSNVQTHTKGTGSTDTVSHTGGYAAGTTSIVTSGFDAGAYVAGDVVTFGSDTEKYVVASSDADTETIVLNRPLKSAVSHGAAITLAANYTANVVFPRSALMLAVRPTAMPQAPGQQYTVITDPNTGISFGLLAWVGYGMITYELHAVYGATAQYGTRGMIGLLG